MQAEYRRAEKMLYTYPLTLWRWQTASIVYQELKASSDVHAQSYSGMHASDGRVSDPAGNYVERLFNLECLLSRLYQTVKTVETVRADLSLNRDERDAQKLLIMEHVYFDGQTMKQLSQTLDISGRTLYRRRQELVLDVVKEMRKTNAEKRKAQTQK